MISILCMQLVPVDHLLYKGGEVCQENEEHICAQQSVSEFCIVTKYTQEFLNDNIFQ